MKKKCVNLAFIALILVPCIAIAQNGAPPGGADGMEQASESVIEWIAPVENLIWASAVIIGLVGGARIAQKMFNGDRDINKDLTSYGGACVLLSVIGIILRSIFLG